MNRDRLSYYLNQNQIMMKRNIIVTIAAIAVLTACGTTKRSGQTSAAGPDSAAAAAAAAAETLAAIPCRCDSAGYDSPWVRFLRPPEQVTYQIGRAHV